MIEETVRAFLAGQLDVPALLELPPHPPEAFVLVEKTGGYVENGLRHATLAVQSYGPRLLEAARLNDTLKDCMEDLALQDDICRVELNSDYNFTDTENKRYRYQAVFDIIYY